VGTALFCVGCFTLGVLVGQVIYRELQHRLRELFTLQDVHVTGLVHVTREDVLARAGLPGGETLFTISPALLKKRLEGHPWIKEVRISRQIPRAVAIDLVERQPAAVLHATTSTFLLDADGIVLTRLPAADDSVLPLLTGIDPALLQAGDGKARRAVQVGVKLAGMIGETYDGRPEINVGNPDNAVAHVQGLRFEFGMAPFEEKWAQYHKVESTVRARLVESRGDMRNEIDLRYPGKVIVRERG
jgi:hypothetical protein